MFSRYDSRDLAMLIAVVLFFIGFVGSFLPVLSDTFPRNGAGFPARPADSKGPADRKVRAPFFVLRFPRSALSSRHVFRYDFREMTLPNLAMLIAVVLFTVGFVGSFLPVLPGNAIVWLGIFIHKMMLGDASVSWTFFWIATVLAIVAQILDYFFTYWGARRFGATWQGAVGGVVGGIVGMIFFNLPGLILGPVVGVLAVEFARSQDLRAAARASFGTIVGGLIAFAAKLALTMVMIAGFFMSLADWF